MDAAFEFLRQKVNDYSPFSDDTWQVFKKCCQLRPVSKGEVLYPIGEVPISYSFVVCFAPISSMNKAMSLIKIFLMKGFYWGDDCTA
ncbi:hypothetical protein [Colwellia sp. C1TZA3]|uniref:hypothetical protein n=1 Tax=Colwellia sp. C1TZA3 TaxID=2508879 RepID=UPI0011B987D5|nr:hypothetical protein [Colwellia sp. C1TZA3]TWX63436.1 hypothetical protein ESZ39_16925 [Colwellia sp. C1TZA3]